MANYLQLLPTDLLSKTLEYVPKIMYLVETDDWDYGDRVYIFHGLFDKLEDAIICYLKFFGKGEYVNHWDDENKTWNLGICKVIFKTYIREVEVGKIDLGDGWKYQLTQRGILKYKNSDYLPPPRDIPDPLPEKLYLKDAGELEAIYFDLELRLLKFLNYPISH